MFGRLILLLMLLLSFGSTLSTQAQSERIEIRQWANSASASSEFGDLSWSAMQATGAPNTPGCGDHATAWASASSSEVATLTLGFGVAVTPTQVNIYQTYNPGAITGIELLAEDGSTIAVPDSSDNGELDCPHVFILDFPDDMPPVTGLTLHLDQSITGSWNEIDAVELVGMATLGREISMWADYAQATSQYSLISNSASQVLGPPDSPDCVDSGTAWASADAQGADLLLVMFPHLVIPTQLDIYQNWNPGAITRVDLIASDGGLVTISNSADPGTPCPGYMALSIQTDVIANGAIIHLDQSITGNWNEIDAVQITGTLADDGLLRQWASTATATSQYGETSWSATQATGPADTLQCGDYGTAWASATSTGQDTLTLQFAQPVNPSSVLIYQSYNPGAIVGLDLLPADGGAPISVGGVEDASGIPCPGILVVDILEDTPPISGVALHLDQSITGSWNEIDAVRLIGRPVSSK